jgi:hypothetical protein
VGEAAREEADRLHLLGVEQLGLELNPFGHVHELTGDADRRAAAVAERRGVDVDPALLAVLGEPPTRSPVATPPWIVRAIRACDGIRSSGGVIASGIGRPTTSSADQPKIRSLAGFQIVTFRSRSNAWVATGDERTIADRISEVRSSSASARSRAGDLALRQGERGEELAVGPPLEGEAEDDDRGKAGDRDDDRHVAEERASRSDDDAAATPETAARPAATSVPIIWRPR